MILSVIVLTDLPEMCINVAAHRYYEQAGDFGAIDYSLHSVSCRKL